MYRSLDNMQPNAPTPPVWWKVILFVLLPSLVTFVVVDLVWIVFVASPMFQEVLGTLVRQPPNPVSGLMAWICIVSGVYYFAVRTASSTKMAAVQGVLMGAALYGTYEFTNHSVIGTWTWTLAFGDFAWGSFACTCSALVQYQLLCWCSSR